MSKDLVFFLFRALFTSHRQSIRLVVILLLTNVTSVGIFFFCHCLLLFTATVSQCRHIYQAQPSEHYDLAFFHKLAYQNLYKCTTVNQMWFHASITRFCNKRNNSNVTLYRQKTYLLIKWFLQYNCSRTVKISKSHQLHEYQTFRVSV